MRNLNEVIQQMLDAVPDLPEANGLRTDLEKWLAETRYRAPEAQDWHGMARVLALHIPPINDLEWSDEILEIWRGEK